MILRRSLRVASRLSVWALAVFLFAVMPGAAPAQGQSLVVAVGFAAPLSGGIVSRVAPGSIVTLYTTGLDVPDAVATEVPWPISLSGVSVSIRVVGAADTTGYPTSLRILRVYSVRVPAKANAVSEGKPNGVPG